MKYRHDISRLIHASIGSREMLSQWFTSAFGLYTFFFCESVIGLPYQGRQPRAAKKDLDNLSGIDASSLGDSAGESGPVRMKDIEAARDRIIDSLLTLAAQGTISIDRA